MKKFILSMTCAILPLFGWGQNNNNIQFADEIVKSLSVASWDTNGDGELSYSEAAAVTSLGNVFRGSTITSFDELQYFTGLTDISPQAFSECMNLEDITLPSTITAIGQGAFVMCDNLRNISIPASVTAIGDGAFWECMSLEEIFCYVANPFNIQEQVFFQPTYENATLHVPQGTKDLYHNTEFWSNFANIVDDLGTQQQSIPEPYAVLSQNNTVLTFYYDTNRGAFQGSMDVTSTAWLDFKEQITTAVFDASFADCTTLTSTSSWFADCKKLTIIEGIENLNTQNVTNMGSMFLGCEALTSLDVSHFNTEKVTDMSYMFSVCSALTNIDVSHFNTSHVTNMIAMFGHCSSLTSLDLSNFNTENVTNMLHMFNDCHTLTTLDLSSFNTANVTSMIGMFFGCAGLKTIFVSDSWSTSNVSEGIEVFYECNNLVGGRGTRFNHEHIDYTYAHIDGGTANPGYFTAAGAEPWTEPEIEVVLTGKNANYWYDETGTDPNGDEAVVFTLPENADGSNLWEINVLNAFIRNQLAFTTPEGEAVDNITGEFRFESEGNMVALNDGKMLMYESADEQGEIAMIEPGMGMMRIINNEITQRLLNEPNSQFMALPVNVMAYQDGKEVPVINGRFTVLVRLEKQQKEPEPYAVLSQNNTVLTFYYDTNKERMNGMSVGPFEDRVTGWFFYDELITKVVFDQSIENCTSITSTAHWFSGLSNLTTIENLRYLNTSNVTSFNQMFNGCSKLTSLDVSGFNTEKVTNMLAVFSGCRSLTTLDVSGFNTSNVTTMASMFDSCSELTSLDVSGFNTEKVTDMNRMFIDCSSLTNLDVHNFRTSNVTNMSGMFASCSNLTSLDVSSFNTENVTDIGAMFMGCSKLTALDLSTFITNKVTTVQTAFYDCSRLTILDLSNFNTENVTDMYFMLGNCFQLTTVYASNEWSTTNVTRSTGMFSGCSNLVGGAGTRWDANHTDYTYAHIDGGENNPGYFTDKNAEPWTDLEPYAVLSRNNTVMTFYYDDKMEEKGGISLEDDRWEGRERELSSSIVALVFDESFSDFVVNEAEDFNINLAGWTSLAAVRAGNVRIPAEEYAKVGNPNLLVYVNEPSLAPQGVQNVVVNGLAREIVLTNATEGNNNWHCPEPFRAERITYTRNFRQQTEVGISRGWESIALPFTVQTITHETQGRIIPFGAQGTGKYFWLRGYSPEGLHRATVLEANTPYVISMPNNPTVYPSEYNLNGRVTFSAENATVPATPEFEEMLITRGNITMAPIFVTVPQDEVVYAINVSQPLDRYAEGSVFARELREVRPFEAATTHEPVNGARPKYIRIAAQPDDDITGIRTIELDETEGTWYSLDGRQMQGQPQRKGVYLQKGKKVVVK